MGRERAYGQVWGPVDSLPSHAITRTPAMSDPKISSDRHFTIKQMPYQTRSDALNTAGVLGNKSDQEEA